MIRKVNRSVLPSLLSGAVCAFGFSMAATAFAQEREKGDYLEELVVTAQKREQSGQNVPISLQIIDKKLIEDLAADDIGDMAQFIPGLEIDSKSPTQPTYQIRGIQTSNFGVGTDSAVGVYVDGVYSARSGSALLAFTDIARIEVLKGPQGTLFGRNAAAGAVSVITNQPEFEQDGFLTLRAGNFGKLRVEGMANLPLSDSLAVRFNAVKNERDGLFTDAATGEKWSRQDNWALRTAFKWLVTPDTEATLSWIHDKVDQDARPAIGVVNVPASPDLPTFPADQAQYLDPLTAPVYNDALNNREARDLDELTLTVNHELSDSTTLTSITSWREFETVNREDEDGTNRRDLYFDTENYEENESFYQEFRLLGSSDTLQWVAGLSYYDESAYQENNTFGYSDSFNTTLGNIGFGTPFADVEYGLLVPFGINATLFGHGISEAFINQGDYKAYSIFGDLIWSVNDQVNLTFGGRFTKDEKRFSWLNGPRIAPTFDATLQALESAGVLSLAGISASDLQFDLVFDLTAVSGIPCDNGAVVQEGVTCALEDDWNDFSPRLVVDYQLNDTVMAYASYAKGYKAGGYNSVEIASRFEPESVDNMELGVKSIFPDLAMLLNASLFHYVYNDKQSVRLVSQVDGSLVPQYIVTTSDDEAWGVDFEGRIEAAPGLSFFSNVQYIDATYKNLLTRDGENLSGQPTGEPKWSLALGGRFETELDWGYLSLQAIHSYRSETRLNSTSVQQGTGGRTSAFDVGAAQNRTDLKLSWASLSDRYEVGFFVNNLFDKQYVLGVNNITANTMGTPFVNISDPRFWGAEVRVNF